MKKPYKNIAKQFVPQSFADFQAESALFLSSQRLSQFRESPLLYHKTMLGEVESSQRPAYLIGNALHKLVLEGRRAFEDSFVVGGPINPKTGHVYGSNTKAFQAWAARQGKTVLTEAQAKLVEQLSQSLKVHSFVEQLLDDGVAEGVLRADYRNLPCQVRVDWFSPDFGIVDLKTCNDLSWFETDARSFGYLHQMAFYRAVIAARTQVEVPVYLVAVEKKEPYRCGVWQLTPDILDSCQRENEEAMERLLRCSETGVWPTGYESVREFDYV